MISFRESPDIEYNGTENCAVMKLFADTSSELTGVTHFDGILLLHGSSAYVIETGETYMLNGAGTWILQPSQNAFSNVYTTDEIDTMITTIYQYMMYYHTKQESIDGTITFYSFAGVVGNLTIYGNGQKIGTPTPDNPVMPSFCGTLDSTDWTITITCAGQTVPVYLGQTQTVRRIKKLALTGEETAKVFSGARVAFYVNKPSDMKRAERFGLCSHFLYQYSPGGSTNNGITLGDAFYFTFSNDTASALGIVANDIKSFKTWIATEYAAGHPVTVWYVLETPETAIVNEPLAKIGEYADELHITNAGVSIPTVSGENTLTVETTLAPSKIIISGE